MRRADGARCHQMIMGAGKTTVVGPLLALLLGDGKTLVVQVVPAALLEFSRAVMRECFRLDYYLCACSGLTGLHLSCAS